MGVVGPNGCGKSNVMESVRWVLGESSAKEMRGDSMDAVIFNGSATRKPISRASVELIFDNSLGGAAGEWSQYAEISVKRVIERDKGSAYYINNTLVRRRDVADLFLGTGLGGRAYAIIGQNTINRIVEAKPEELRVFLEEAAGISKYKERRRETELRLRDTRENLMRVLDILQELDKQIARLQSQAVVAEAYKNLQDALKLNSAMVWALKKREAGVAWEKSRGQVQQMAAQLEAQMAGLRLKERDLEKARQGNFLFIETLNQAQAAYYQANSELANVENQLKNTQDAQARTRTQLDQLLAQLEKNHAEELQLQGAVRSAQAKLAIEQERIALSEKANQQAGVALPLLLTQFQIAQSELDTAQAKLIVLDQQLRSEQSHIAYTKRSIVDLNLQLEKLQLNLAEIDWDAGQHLDAQQAELKRLQASIVNLEAMSAASLAKEAELSAQVKTNQDAQLLAQGELSALEAEQQSLMKIQLAIKNANDEVGLNRWLTLANLQAKPRTWQAVSVKAGWETALEAALGPKLNAINVSALPTAERPPSALTLTLEALPANLHEQSNGRTSLYSIISNTAPEQEAALQDWLRGVYLLEEADDVEQARLSLREGESLVSKQGDLYSKYSVTYFATQSILHGVLERQAQLQILQRKLPTLQATLAKAQAELRQAEMDLQAVRAEQFLHTKELKQATHQAHQLNLACQQQEQQLRNNRQKQTDLELERASLNDKLALLTAEMANKEQSVQQYLADLQLMQQQKDQAEMAKKQAELELNQARDRLHAMEKTHQELSFNMRLISNEIIELENRINAIFEENSRLKSGQDSLLVSLSAMDLDGLKLALQAAVNEKQRQEQTLTEARAKLNASELALQQDERERMQQEQRLHPLRDKLEASRLSEQEARLNFEQCQAELDSCGLSEQSLSENLSLAMADNKTIKVADLEQARDESKAAIDALGAVNLAAIQELDQEQNRRLYLASQSSDLHEAIETLEDAIHKIDKETRSRLQETFDQANRHFNDLFVTLFGGGQAGLALLGDEILDTGLQVFAQPPGKKNSTIHLLSGGEKALTALALVFALFRLNPAPFCLMDEVDAPLDDSNTERFCAMVKKMSEKTQFLYVSHNKITMEMAQQLIGVTMQESGVSRIVEVDMDAAVQMMQALKPA